MQRIVWVDALICFITCGLEKSTVKFSFSTAAGSGRVFLTMLPFFTSAQSQKNSFFIMHHIYTPSACSENLEFLKRLRKPTYVYGYRSKTGTAEAGEIDPERTYDPYYEMKEYYRKRKARE